MSHYPPSGGPPPRFPPPPPGQFYPPYPPPHPKASKLPWILGATGLVVLLCCGFLFTVALFGGGETNDSGGSVNDNGGSVNDSGSDDGGDGDSAESIGLGMPARDGKFEFVVKSAKCGRKNVGSGFLTVTAQGVFCLVNITVKNIGDDAQLFDSSSQQAFDAAGKEYTNDSEAEFAANEGTSGFIEIINPGNSAAGTLVFDVPKGTKLTKLELHDSPFSGGVTVKLT